MTPNFKLSRDIAYNISQFPGGELHLSINMNTVSFSIPRSIIITGSVTNPSHIMELLLLVDALRRLHVNNLELHMPYFAYGRQDRVANVGEAFSLSVFADLINSCNFDIVRVTDAHSDVTTALINNVVHASNVPFAVTSIGMVMQMGYTIDYAVAPDAGAIKKTYSILAATPIPMQLLLAGKLRNTKTGAITQTVVYNQEEDLVGKTVMIFDDICDGGYTFIKLAEALKFKGVKHVLLYVTHGIFSKGLEPLLANGLIDHIFTTDSWRIPPHKQITVVSDEFSH